MALSSKLTMTCTVTPVSGQDTGGDQTYGSSVTNVKCFAFGNTRRFRNQQQEEYIPDFKLLFLPTVDVGLNYLITDIYSHKNELVLKSGQVVNMEENYHPKRGLVLKQAFVERR